MKTVNIYNLFTAISAVFLLSLGQILLKLASNDIFSHSKVNIFSFINIKLFFAFIAYAIATLAWFMTIKEIPLRVAYPFVALAFIVVPVMGHFFLGETIKWNALLGALFIMIGVCISTFK